MYYESYYGIVPLGDYLAHYGVKGQKWGVRRYQYENGLLTPLGRQRLGYGERKQKHDDIVLKKGTKVSRYANEEALDNRRKYVSLSGSKDDDEYLAKHGVKDQRR